MIRRKAVALSGRREHSATRFREYAKLLARTGPSVDLTGCLAEDRADVRVGA